MLNRKDLLGLRDVSAEEITLILDTAEKMKRALNGGDKCSDVLKGKTLVTLFYENSTRTRCSFELAGEYFRFVKLRAEGGNPHRYGQDLAGA